MLLITICVQISRCGCDDGTVFYYSLDLNKVSQTKEADMDCDAPQKQGTVDAILFRRFCTDVFHDQA